MKKGKTFLVMLLAAGSLCLTGCSSQFEANQNTVRLKKDGTVMAAVIDKLDKSYYSEEELKATIDEAVAKYNDAAEGQDKEKEAVVVKKYEVKEGKVELYMNYADSSDYQAFNNVSFYAADLQGAYDNKYEFPETFRKVDKGEVTGTVTKKDILNGLNYYVLIYSEEMDVEVPGKIVYVSPDVTVTGKKTATNRPEAAKSEIQTEKEDKSNDTGESAVEEGKFEVEEGTLETEAADTEEETEETEHTLTFIIYE